MARHRCPPPSGSSPRVRGKLGGEYGHGLPPRLIPARAGKTNRYHIFSFVCGAHPRACGENLLRFLLGGVGGGSSPRVRGKLDVAGVLEDRHGLIPARAGKTQAVRSLHAEEAGSSPRVRGKPGPGLQEAARRGLIPARAGKTRPRRHHRRRTRAHPRACGENCRTPGSPGSAAGSSPRVRGKLLALPALAAAGGLIPARAGKTPCPSRSTRNPRAHPRACGENGTRAAM